MAERETLVDIKSIISFIGPEGSGKTTTAELLASNLGRPYITTGGILRYLRDNDPGPLGDECRKMFEEHTYLSGESLLRVLADRFSKEDVVNGFILDGGFRTVEEIEGFPEVLKLARLELPLVVIYLQIPKEVSLDRLRARKRDDDDDAGIEARLEKFYFRLDDRLERIRKEPNWKLVEVGAHLPKATVYDQVCLGIIQALVA